MKSATEMPPEIHNIAFPFFLLARKTRGTYRYRRPAPLRRRIRPDDGHPTLGGRMGCDSVGIRVSKRCSISFREVKNL
ncbi:hypothetical protein [Burkholderia ubonensis]|uniref:hypothetical protein n=1 Tax=Burkholderia ubonensis TaxID=101571 RepID=UPI002ABE87A7|nr:hypothetical protein [Burkholderia ubonensis]